MSQRGNTERLGRKRQLQNKAGRFTDGYAQGFRDGWNDGRRAGRRSAIAAMRHRSRMKKKANARRKGDTNA